MLMRFSVYGRVYRKTGKPTQSEVNIPVGIDITEQYIICEIKFYPPKHSSVGLIA